MLFTLFDSGATFSCIHTDFPEKIANPLKMLTPLDIATASLGTYLRIEEKIVTEFIIDDRRMSDEFAVVPNLCEYAIIGLIPLQKWLIKHDFEHHTVIIDPKISKAKLKELK